MSKNNYFNPMGVFDKEVKPIFENEAQLRDYFAAAALQGIITKGTYSSVAMMSCGKSFDYERLAYIVADRMLAARKEGA